MGYIEQIETIMDYFDFHKVHNTMTALEWGWFDVEGVPDVPDLRKAARGLLRPAALNGPDVTYATRGFEARNDKWGQLSLKFAVECFNIDTE